MNTSNQVKVQAFPLIQFNRVHPDAVLPRKAHANDAGYDIFTVEDVLIEKGPPKLVRTGWALSIPSGWKLDIRPRSGLSLKTGLIIKNSPGTIDSSYRGEVGVICSTLCDTVVLEKGQAFAQFVLSPVWDFVVDIVNSLDPTDRGSEGFGSTDTLGGKG